MRKENFKQFDMVMANLRSVEPSSSFDFEFRRRLKEAVRRKHEETAFETLARRTAESLRYVFLPKVPAFARVAATVIVLIALGLYTYSVQPASPVMIAKKGVVLIQGFKIGDVIATEDNSGLDIALSKKYAIRLKDNTRIKIAHLTPRYGKGKAIFELIDGRMLVSVEKGFKGSRFVVDTKTAEATALGTKFMVDVREKKDSKTEVSVLEGKVRVKSRYKPKELVLAKQTVIVDSGQKTEISAGRMPLPPERMIEEEWRQLEELYQIGRKPRVILLVKNTPDRVKELLGPCPIYISDEKPREIPKLLENAVLKMAEALDDNDKNKYIESLKLLERIVDEYPNPKYDVQLLLYIGASYNYISEHKKAIEIFKRALNGYPDSPLASMAQCAIGIIYEENLKEPAKASEAFKKVLRKYPNSLEAILVEEKLGIKKSG